MAGALGDMEPNNYERRLNHIETSVTAMSVKIDSLASAFTSIISEIKTVHDRLSNSSKTNWGVLASWLGVLVTFMAIYSGLLINPIREKVDATELRLFQALENRLKDREKIARLEEQVKMRSAWKGHSCDYR